MRTRPSLTRFAWLSISAAVATMALKLGAYWITGSVGLLSDAVESGVNLAAALLALAVLTVVAQPPDEEHAYGHEKAEYFSSGVEGALIVLAAITIAFEAGQRLLDPQPIQRLGLGLTISAAATVINLMVAVILARAGRRHRSIALEADAQHLMADVWTSGALLVGVGVIALTGLQVLDPLLALGAAAHLAWSGFRLVRRSTQGLMDAALPSEDVRKITQVLENFTVEGVHYHALRTRQAGARAFVSVHIQVPGEWSIQRGHDLLEAIEAQIRRAVPSASVFTHIEPVEDPASWQDQLLDPPAGEEEALKEPRGPAA